MKGKFAAAAFPFYFPFICRDMPENAGVYLQESNKFPIFVVLLTTHQGIANNESRDCKKLIQI